MAKGYHLPAQDQRSRSAAFVTAKISISKDSRSFEDKSWLKINISKAIMTLAAHKEALEMKSRSCYGKPGKIVGTLKEKIIFHMQVYKSRLDLII